MSSTGELKQRLIAGSCNTSSSDVLLWLPLDDEVPGNASLVLFGMHNMVAVATVSGDGKYNSTIEANLRGHTGRVNALCGGIRKGGETEVYSCGVDGQVRVWLKQKGASVTNWECIEVLEGCQSACVGITSLETSEGVYLAASDSSANIVIWFKRHGAVSFTQMQSMKLYPTQTPHSMHFMALAGSDNCTCLLVGSVDSKIHVYCNPPPAGGGSIATDVDTFRACGVLSGHEEWVTCLSSKVLQQADGAVSLLASGSKDFRTRVWSFVCTTTTSSSSSSSSGGGKGVSTDAASNGTAAEEAVAGDDDEDDDGDDIMEVAQSDEAVMIDAEEGQESEARLRFAIPTSSEGGCAAAAAPAAVWCSVYLETLLVGHEDWVTSVQWLPDDMAAALLGDNSTSSKNSTQQEPKYHLFTASMDRNMVLWSGGVSCGSGGTGVPATLSNGSGKIEGKSSSTSHVWVPLTRIGDVGGMLGGSVGANLLGFTAARISPDGRALLGAGYGGSFHLYRFSPNAAAAAATDVSVSGANDDSDGSAAAGGGGTSTFYNKRAAPLLTSPMARQRQWRWLSIPFFTGHFSSVNSLCWSDDGSCFVTSSSDQTARLWACVKATGKWRELSRPQIHGYDLNCVGLATLSGHGQQRGVPRLFSAGDEKMVRVYIPTQEVLRGLRKLAGVDLAPAADSEGNNAGLVSRAFIPELKLSTKPVSQISEEEKAEMAARGVEAVTWASSPLEAQLSDHTVWPEESMLFGHTNDIIALAISRDQVSGKGQWLATACKARNAETAAIIIWDLQAAGGGGKGEKAATLLGHDSTVTCLQFSTCGQFLASAGKDRSLCVYRATTGTGDEHGDGLAPFELMACQKGVHKRIVWDLSWVPRSTGSTDAQLLATGSRDGLCKVWQVLLPGAAVQPDQSPLQCLLTFEPFSKVAVTALSFSVADGSNLLAIGSEHGAVSVWRWCEEERDGIIAAKEICSAPSECSHAASVKCLRWRPNQQKGDELEIASCGEDHTVRVLALAL
jgi:elongator complex protein 2